MQQRIEKLEKQVKWLGACVLILATVVVSLITLAAKSEPDGAKILRARGLIIEDDQGRERILIGAPIPAAKNRVRTDLDRAKGLWGEEFGEKRMAAYRDLRNESNGIVILNADGFDRIAIGDPVPDPNIGKRNALFTGIVTNDSRGFERTGYGVNPASGRDQVMLNLDYAGTSGEALVLSAVDAGSGTKAAGMTMWGQNRSLYVGSGDGTLIDLPGEQGPFNGIAIQEGKEVKYELNVAKPSPAK